jgi:hypothetical protein
MRSHAESAGGQKRYQLTAILDSKPSLLTQLNDHFYNSPMQNKNTRLMGCSLNFRSSELLFAKGPERKQHQTTIVEALYVWIQEERRELGPLPQRRNVIAQFSKSACFIEVVVRSILSIPSPTSKTYAQTPLKLEAK